MTVKRAADLSELSEGAMHCRAFGHRWLEHGQTPRVKGWTITMACDSCGTLKLFQLSQRGELTAPRYVYPDFYLARFFIGQDERAAMRLEVLAPLLARGNMKIVNGGKADKK